MPAALVAAAPQKAPVTFWRCSPPDFDGILDIRSTPAIAGIRTGEGLENGEVFGVNQEVEAEGGITYLRLADGRGWVFNRKPGVGIVCVRHKESSAGPGPGPRPQARSPRDLDQDWSEELAEGGHSSQSRVRRHRRRPLEQKPSSFVIEECNPGMFGNLIPSCVDAKTSEEIRISPLDDEDGDRYVARTFHWRPEDFQLEVATYMQTDEPWQSESPPHQTGGRGTCFKAGRPDRGDAARVRPIQLDDEPLDMLDEEVTGETDEVGTEVAPSTSSRAAGTGGGTSDAVATNGVPAPASDAWCANWTILEPPPAPLAPLEGHGNEAIAGTTNTRDKDLQSPQPPPPQPLAPPPPTVPGQGQQAQVVGCQQDLAVGLHGEQDHSPQATVLPSSCVGEHGEQDLDLLGPPIAASEVDLLRQQLEELRRENERLRLMKGSSAD